MPQCAGDLKPGDFGKLFIMALLVRVEWSNDFVEIASTIANAPEVVRSVFVGHKEEPEPEPELPKPSNLPLDVIAEKVSVSEPLEDILPVFDENTESKPNPKEEGEKQEEKDAQKLMETPFGPP